MSSELTQYSYFSDYADQDKKRDSAGPGNPLFALRAAKCLLPAAGRTSRRPGVAGVGGEGGAAGGAGAGAPVGGAAAGAWAAGCSSAPASGPPTQRGPPALGACPVSIAGPIELPPTPPPSVCPP